MAPGFSPAFVSKFPGGHRSRVTPVPIPNTEVKPATADGTARATAWESRSLPGVFVTGPPESLAGSFCVLPAATHGTHRGHAVARAGAGQSFALARQADAWRWRILSASRGKSYQLLLYPHRESRERLMRGDIGIPAQVAVARTGRSSAG